MCVIVVLVINSCCIKGSFKAIDAHLGALPDVQGVRCSLYTSFAVCVCLQWKRQKEKNTQEDHNEVFYLRSNRNCRTHHRHSNLLIISYTLQNILACSTAAHTSTTSRKQSETKKQQSRSSLPKSVRVFYGLVLNSLWPSSSSTGVSFSRRLYPI